MSVLAIQCFNVVWLADTDPDSESTLQPFQTRFSIV